MLRYTVEYESPHGYKIVKTQILRFVQMFDMAIHRYSENCLS